MSERATRLAADRAASGAKTDRLNRIGGLQNHEIGIASNCEAAAVEVHHSRGVGRNRLKPFFD
jgi:hypothetical protein